MIVNFFNVNRQIRALGVFIFLVLTNCTNAADEKFASYSVGFSTPNIPVWVSAAYLDKTIGILGGSIQGAWEEADKTNGVFDAPMPREIYVNWEERDTGKRYEATVKMVTDLASKAKGLPRFHFENKKTEEAGERVLGPDHNKGIYLIIGLAANGKVTVWLSNAPHGNGITQRVLYVVGESAGVEISESSPDQSRKLDN